MSRFQGVLTYPEKQRQQIYTLPPINQKLSSPRAQRQRDFNFENR
jgi:hypothetical protein